jgi:hypothetical protein
MISVRRSAAVAAFAGIAVLAVAARAHHSHGNYQLQEYTYLTGTVKEVLWINPHTWIHLAVAGANGETIDWALEGGGINALTRRGWKEGDVKPGDTISVRCHQLRDGARGCLLGYVSPEGGVEKEWD